MTRDAADRLGHTTPEDETVSDRRRTSMAAALRRGPNSREAQHLLTAELLEEIRRLNETSSEMAARLRSGILNGVLLVELAVFDATGLVERTFNTTAGSAAIVNHGSADIIVSSAPAGPAAPGQGKGIQLIPAGAGMTVPVGTRTLTLYGTTGQKVSVQVFTGTQAWNGGGR